MNTIQVSLSQVQELVKHASREGLYVGFCFTHDGQLLEGIVQLPSKGADEKVVHDPKGHRDIVVIRNEGEHTVEIRSELGEIFVDMFLPRAA